MKFERVISCLHADSLEFSKGKAKQKTEVAYDIATK
jgi:hypothetical protein